MADQQFHNCEFFSIGGSYNRTVNLNVITQSYYQRGTSSSSRSRRLPDSLSKLLLEAEHLQQIAEWISQELKLDAKLPIEYNELSATLDEIVEQTIPCIFSLFIDAGYHLNKRSEARVLAELTCMQGILDDFASKRATDRDQALQGPQRTVTVGAIINLFWTYFLWLLFIKYLVVSVRESLGTSRDRIYVALFESIASSMGRTVRCHQIDIDDFFGVKWSLPQDLCLDRQVFLSILRYKFQGGPAELVIVSEQFSVFRHDGLRAIQASDWESVIKEGDSLQLSVLISRQSEDIAGNSLECPQCRRSDKTVSGDCSDGWVLCLRCNSTYNATSIDSEGVGDDNARNQSSSRRKPPLSAGLDQYSSSFRCFSIMTLTRKFHEAKPKLSANVNKMHDASGPPTQIGPDIPTIPAVPDQQDPITTNAPVNTIVVAHSLGNGPVIPSSDEDEKEARLSSLEAQLSSRTSTSVKVTVNLSALLPSYQGNVDISPRAHNFVDMEDLAEQVRARTDTLSRLLLNKTKWRKSSPPEDCKPLLNIYVDQFLTFCVATVSLLQNCANISRRFATLFKRFLDLACFSSIEREFKELWSQVEDIRTEISSVEGHYTNISSQFRALLSIAPLDTHFHAQNRIPDDREIFRRLDAFWKVVTIQLSSALETTSSPHISDEARISWGEYQRSVLGVMDVLMQSSDSLRACAEESTAYRRNGSSLSYHIRRGLNSFWSKV